MKFTLLTLTALIGTSSAFSSPSRPQTKSASAALQSSMVDSLDEFNNRPIRDPLGLYPSDAPERNEGRILPLETTVDGNDKAVIDPLNLYSDKSMVTASSSSTRMSRSLPFLERPAMLDGTLPGDRGFDPFNLSFSEGSLQWYRNSELKHARLAMLAAVGWPLAELMNKSIDRVPSVLNGGLGHVSPVFWASLLTVLSTVEILGIFNQQRDENNGLPGNYGVDPLGFFFGSNKTDEQRMFQLEGELFNGRLAMLAITTFAIQEWLTQAPVIETARHFFHPF